MAGRARIGFLDVVRGGAMVLMALDHVRAFMTDARVDPVDPAATTVALFATRWVTHLVAPAFVFLAGVGAYLYGTRPGRTRADLARFLWTRGLWLVLVEFTLVNLGWMLVPQPQYQFAQVIWAIGVSMVALAGLVLLPRAWVLGVGLAIVLLHNLLDPIDGATVFVAASEAGVLQVLWMALHAGGAVVWGDVADPAGFVWFNYPVLPWIGLMAVGYGAGALWQADAARRRRVLLLLAGAAFGAFLVLRVANVYGDPNPWTAQPRGAAYTLLSFLNVTKYPPSLAYLLVTLSPAFLALALLERAQGPVVDRLAAIGRVPFFFYVLHLLAIHVAAVGLALAQSVAVRDVVGLALWWGPPETYGVGLPLVYVVTVAVVLSLVPLCAWFGRVKRDHPDRKRLSYL